MKILLATPFTDLLRSARFVDHFNGARHPKQGEHRPVSLTWNRTVDWSSDDWREASACRDVEPELFFPSTATIANEQVDIAKRICNRCNVREQCLDFALRANQEAGIWGGTSEDERRRLRRQWLAARRKAALATAQ